MKNTPNFNLPLYEPNDLANLTDGYNNAMSLIDTDMKAVTDHVDTYDTRITANADAIAAETTRATAAEKVNADAIAAETTRATAAEKVNADAIAAETLRAKESVTKRIVFFGDSWCAKSPGIGMGEKLFQKIRGNKASAGNYAVSGAWFGSESATGVELNTEAQLNACVAASTTEERAAITDVVMICGVNNIGGKVQSAEAVRAHWATFKNAFPNARLHWFFSSKRAFWNTEDSGFQARAQYPTYIQGGLAAGVTVYENSLVWLKSANESDFWDGDSLANRHPNETGIEIFTTIAANSFDTGTNTHFISEIPVTINDEYSNDANYLYAELNGLNVTIFGTIVGNFNKTSQVCATISNQWVSPIVYNEVPCVFNTVAKQGIVRVTSTGNITIDTDTTSSGFVSFYIAYPLM